MRFAEQSSPPDTYQMRYALEGFAARMAAHVVSDDDIAWFEDNLADLHVALTENALDDASQLDFDFHMRIIHLAGNAAIESVLRSSADIMKESQRMPFYRRELLLSTWQEHRAIVDALIARDAGAAGIAIERTSRTPRSAGIFFPTPARDGPGGRRRARRRSCRSTSRRIPIRERTLDERTRRDAAVRALRVSSAPCARRNGSISSALVGALARDRVGQHRREPAAPHGSSTALTVFVSIAIFGCAPCSMKYRSMRSRVANARLSSTSGSPPARPASARDGAVQDDACGPSRARAARPTAARRCPAHAAA